MNREKHLETILVLVVALLVFYWIFKGPYLLTAAVIIGGIGLFIPFLAEKIHWAWMKLAHVLGYVMNKVLLTAVYCIVLLPLAMLSRVFKKKSSVQLQSGENSYFQNRNFTYTKESMENVW